MSAPKFDPSGFVCPLIYYTNFQIRAVSRTRVRGRAQVFHQGQKPRRGGHWVFRRGAGRVVVAPKLRFCFAHREAPPHRPVAWQPEGMGNFLVDGPDRGQVRFLHVWKSRNENKFFFVNFLSIVHLIIKSSISLLSVF